MMLNERRAMMEKAGGRLPAEYQEVEWISSDGIAYIQTETQLSDFSGAEIDMSAASNYKTQYADSNKLVCANKNESVINIGIMFRGGRSYYMCRNDNNMVSAWVADGNRHVYKCFNKTAYLDGERVGSTTSTRANSGRAQILYYTSNDFKLYECKILRGFDTPDFDGIPCYRKSDGVIGLYDLCGTICTLTDSPFYINAREGGFTKGPDV